MKLINVLESTEVNLSKADEDKVNNTMGDLFGNPVRLITDVQLETDPIKGYYKIYKIILTILLTQMKR